MIRFTRIAAAVLMVGAVAAEASAQDAASVPPCTGPHVEAEPCRARFDTPPALDPASEPPLPPGERSMPRVWILVDSAGTAARALVYAPTRAEWDFAARDRALRFRFHPAMLDGRPVAAWVLMPVAAVPPPHTCADVHGSVPLSAGALLLDSVPIEPPGRGTQFIYGADGFRIDLFIYPHAEGRTPRDEVEAIFGFLARGAMPGGPDSAVVVRRGAQRLRPSERFRSVEFAGYSAVYRARLEGRRVESYVGVFPAGGEDLKVRATYPPSGESRRAIEVFLQQILSERAWRMNGCPR
jgi:hypothetical protein